MHLVARALILLIATAGALLPALALALDPPASQSMTVLGPGNPQLAAGATALEKGDVKEGIRLTLEGLRSPADNREKAAGHSNLCAGYALQKRWDEALRHCNAALAIDNANWRTFNNRAAVMVGKGDYDLAITDIRSGLEIAPNSSTLLTSLRIIQQNKRLAGARSRSAVRP
jgi:tetratricopeptide (TPR) repeat protein